MSKGSRNRTADYKKFREHFNQIDWGNPGPPEPEESRWPTAEEVYDISKAEGLIPPDPVDQTHGDPQ